jgi:hypothetical protein
MVLFGAGGVFMVAGPVLVHGAPPMALILTGLGLAAAGCCLGSLSWVAGIGCTNALVWYGRLHMRLLKPALESQGI